MVIWFGAVVVLVKNLVRIVGLKVCKKEISISYFLLPVDFLGGNFGKLWSTSPFLVRLLLMRLRYSFSADINWGVGFTSFVL